MFKHCLNMQIQRNVQRWGNGAGILLPREWLGKEVQVILVDRSLEIKKEVMNILDSYLLDVFGIYLTGSYARNEQNKNSDIDVLVISEKINKNIKSGKYDISIVTLDSVKKTIKKNPILIVPRLVEARTILNNSLLEELLKEKFTKNSFRSYFEDTKRIIKINKGFLDIDLEKNLEFLDSTAIIYSMVLRLRGIFLIKNLLEKKKYSKKSFLDFLGKNLNEEEINRVYSIYESVRDETKIKEKITIETAEKLLNLLKGEVNFLT